MLVASVALVMRTVAAQTPSSAREEAAAIVTHIQRADFEGDRTALQRLYGELTPLTDNTRLASRVRYWRGFAMWRRALNGFNDAADRGDIERDLQRAVAEFRAALTLDGVFVDAKVAEVSCLQNLTFLHQTDAGRVQELVNEFVPLFNESVAAAPDNPRLLWVQGASQWYARPGLSASEIATRQAAALETYARGLAHARKHQAMADDRLEPSWGEPELLMNLAWSNLNKATPDVRAAEAFALQALALIPYWHYVRDILMTQIRKAKGQ
jgi:hypothetical protein